MYASEQLSKFNYDTLATCSIYFRHDRAAIDSTYLDNQTSLNALRSALEQIALDGKESIASIVIEASSSPVGHETYNHRLSNRRAKKTEAFLRTVPGFDQVEMLVVGKGEDWQKFAEDIRANYKRKNRQALLDILDQDIPNNEKKKKIQALDYDGTTWRHLSVNYMTTSRHTVTIVVVKKSRIPVNPVPELDPLEYTPQFEAPESLIDVPEVSYVEGRYDHMIMAARTNLLIPGMNFGVEFPIKNHWSVGFDYYFPWLLPESNKWCFQTLAGFVDVKYWFPGNKYKWTFTDKLQGHAVGAYAGLGLYDYQLDLKGLQGEFVDFGVDYTYAKPLLDGKLRIDFNIGIGFIRTWYRPYYMSSDYSDLIKEPGIKYNTTNVFGPTKASISLVVPIVVNTRLPKKYRAGGAE